MYHSSGILWGLLIDADPGVRAYMDDEILLTRMWVIASSSELEVANGQSGGGSEKDAQGNLVQVKDHKESNKNITSLLHSKNTKTPIGVIVGSFNPPI
jgi:hypothetical protein